ncbi:MAG: hypothetical protein KA465_02695 [Anaerolineaceae bacterium]|nr:hypothetical protein [Anaerolineaceae bacterium]
MRVPWPAARRMDAIFISYSQGKTSEQAIFFGCTPEMMNDKGQNQLSRFSGWGTRIRT